MSLKKPEVRFWPGHDVKAAIKILAKIRGVTEADICDEIISPVVLRQVHEATLISAEAALAGISRRSADKSGEERSGAEKRGAHR